MNARASTFISVDLFAGGGGASEGIRRATGRCPIVAVNHCEHAIEMHRANHPTTKHHHQDVWDTSPRDAVGRRLVDLTWASPDCTHHSRARGGKPRSGKLRALPMVVLKWARELRPRVFMIENVPEFVSWGPLDAKGHPIPGKAGETFRQFVGRLQLMGYRVEWEVLNAADYGTPTSRRRLYLIARCDGEPIVWPDPTHGPGRAHPYRTAAEVIDWTIPSCSIFATTDEAKAWAREHGVRGVPRRPLAEATQRRIAAGLRRYVLEAADPFIVPTSEGLAAPAMVQTGYGERKGQAPRALDLHSPLGTIVAGGQKHGLVTAWLAKHYGGGPNGKLVEGVDLRSPLGTVTARDSQGPVFAALSPEATGRAAQVAAFIVKYYGQGGQHQRLDEPLHTIVTKARFGLVTVQLGGEEYVVTDIAMRMLQPRELARAQGFGDDYVLIGNKAQQVARIGNSVCPPVVEALVSAQFPSQQARRAA